MLDDTDWSKEEKIFVTQHEKVRKQQSKYPQPFPHLHLYKLFFKDCQIILCLHTKYFCKRFPQEYYLLQV